MSEVEIHASGTPPDMIYGTIFFLISEPSCHVENGVHFAPTHLLIDPSNLVDCLLSTL